MDVAAQVEAIKASLIRLGITGAPLAAIVSLVQSHAAYDAAKHVGAPVEPWYGSSDLGKIAGDFLASSLRRKELIGRAADDPSWNMLLAIFSNDERGARTSVSFACHQSGAAPSTALRHIETLVSTGVIRRTPDPTDLRRSYLSLTADSSNRMRELIRSFCVEPPPGGGR